MANLTIDKSHSEATFQVRHLVTKVRGRFTDLAGTIQIDEAHPEKSSVSITIQAASINTDTPDRDTHLRSGDFFEVEKYPTITFASTKVAKAGDAYAVTGNLSIHGVSKEVTIPVTALGSGKDPWGGVRYGFEAETTINRKEFGLHYNAALEAGGFLIGDEVKVALNIEAVAAA